MGTQQTRRSLVVNTVLFVTSKLKRAKRKNMKKISLSMGSQNNNYLGNQSVGMTIPTEGKIIRPDSISNIS